MAKLRLLQFLNLILIIGVSISLIGNYVWLICVGRFIWGLALGAFTVVCAKMVDEITPVELSGPLGAANQLACTFGIAIPCTLALAYPRNIKKVEIQDENDFYINQYFRVIWSIPIAIAII